MRAPERVIDPFLRVPFDFLVFCFPFVSSFESLTGRSSLSIFLFLLERPYIGNYGTTGFVFCFDKAFSLIGIAVLIKNKTRDALSQSMLHILMKRCVFFLVAFLVVYNITSKKNTKPSSGTRNVDFGSLRHSGFLVVYA